MCINMDTTYQIYPLKWQMFKISFCTTVKPGQLRQEVSQGLLLPCKLFLLTILGKWDDTIMTLGGIKEWNAGYFLV